MNINAADLRTLSNSAVTDLLERTYAEAKPVNDRMVDISLDVLTVQVEIYRRSIEKHLPGIPIDETKVAVKIGCNINPAKGLPEMVKRITEIQNAGHAIIRVEHETNLNEFRFYVETATAATEETTP